MFPGLYHARAAAKRTPPCRCVCQFAGTRPDQSSISQHAFRKQNTRTTRRALAICARSRVSRLMVTGWEGDAPSQRVAFLHRLSRVVAQLQPAYRHDTAVQANVTAIPHSAQLLILLAFISPSGRSLATLS